MATAGQTIQVLDVIVISATNLILLYLSVILFTVMIDSCCTILLDWLRPRSSAVIHPTRCVVRAMRQSDTCFQIRCTIRTCNSLHRIEHFNANHGSLGDITFVACSPGSLHVHHRFNDSKCLVSYVSAAMLPLRHRVSARQHDPCDSHAFFTTRGPWSWVWTAVLGFRAMVRGRSVVSFLLILLRAYPTCGGPGCQMQRGGMTAVARSLGHPFLGMDSGF